MWCRNVDSITVARIAAKPLAESAADRVSPEEWSVSEWQHWSSVELLNLGCPPLQPAVEETVLISEVEVSRGQFFLLQSTHPSRAFVMQSLPQYSS